jgi:putative ABC transport system permease protein
MSAPSKLLPADVLRTGAAGLRTRPLRVVLSALGIALGIAAMVCVVGIASSSRAGLDRELARLGTNLLRVSPGHMLDGSPSALPPESVEMIGRIGPVTSVSAIAELGTVHIYSNDKVSAGETGNLGVVAARTDLLDTLHGQLAAGAWFNGATARYPTVVLGADAAQRLAVDRPSPEVKVWLGGRWFTVIGVLQRVQLAPELDFAALVGWQQALDDLGFAGHPTVIYTRTTDASVLQVREVLGRTAYPEHPSEVEVTRPSDALAAKQVTFATLDALLLGLGAVALLVGGVGVANTMVISVLERRGEIGLRRSLGATRGHIRAQFLAESLLLSAVGGAAGVLLGVAVTMGYATMRGWPTAVPAWATVGGFAATLLVGACAGVYPAWRAARLSPTEALTAP